MLGEPIEVLNCLTCGRVFVSHDSLHWEVVMEIHPNLVRTRGREMVASGDSDKGFCLI
jgi:hypothetical protein